VFEWLVQERRRRERLKNLKAVRSAVRRGRFRGSENFERRRVLVSALAEVFRQGLHDSEAVVLCEICNVMDDENLRLLEGAADV